MTPREIADEFIEAVGAVDITRGEVTALVAGIANPLRPLTVEIVPWCLGWTVDTLGNEGSWHGSDFA